jgi:protein-S-isoprenylcysteine O-methyltransferase Ste14
MKPANRHLRAVLGLLSLAVVLGIATFLPAWTLDYWQGWLCLASFFLSAVAITLYLIVSDPELLERRMRAGAGAEKRKSQKHIQSFTRIFFLLLFVVPALDHRFHWTSVPLPLSIAGNLLIVFGFFIIFIVFRENTYTSGIIEVAAGQQVISTGPYAHVRHPMYSGALVLMLGIPLALGSWYGLLLLLPMTAGILWRLRDEEKFLAANLPGYSDYLASVRSRLLPRIW